MTPQFTTPCFIRKNTPELRAGLEELDRRMDDGFWIDGDYIACSCVEWYFSKRTVSTDELIAQGFVDCGTSEALFLDLAAMRSDTDSRQFFKKGNYLYKTDEQGNLTIPFVHYYSSTPTTRATAQEIIEWRKKNEK